VIHTRNEEFRKTFQRQLAELRSKLAAIPAEQRRVLQEFADQIDEDHCRMNQYSNDFADMVDDLDLTIKAMYFNLWASKHQASPVQQET
jgi:hypothetical protein